MKKRLCIALAMLLFLVTMAGVAGYEMGYRFDPGQNDIIRITESLSISSVPLTLREGDRSRSFDVKIKKHIYPVGNYLLPIYFSHGMTSSVTVDTDAIKDDVRAFIEEEERKPFKEAYITQDCEFFPTQPSTELDIDELADYVISAFPEETEFDVSKFYTLKEDPGAEELESFYKRLCDTEVVYTDGTSISLFDLYPQYSASDNSITYDRHLLEVLVAEAAAEYDDVGRKTVEFKGHNGIFTVSGGTWGNISDTVGEIRRMEDHFDHLRRGGENILPVMKQYFSWDFPRDYIEVDKKAQHVYVVSDNRVIMDTDCVTGRPPKHSTPEGIYYISEKAVNKILRGPGYESFVYRWMRLNNDGIGLHDATWRRKFGDEIYLHDGSHGCINLPKDFAYELYKHVLKFDEDEIVVFVHD